MGSYITLGIGKFEFDWQKNQIFTNHSKLFLKSDIRNEKYYYADNIIKIRKAFSTHLNTVKKRLDLLGYTPKNIKKQFFEHCQYFKNITDENFPLNYEQFCEILAKIDISNVEFADDEEQAFSCEPGYYFNDYIRPKLKIITNPYTNKIYGEFFENIDPYIIIRAYIDNRILTKKDKLIWRYKDLVDGGWIIEDEIYEPIREEDKYLIITEGNSDTKIIKKCIEKFLPEVSEFFQFIDMNENYPFTGTGNLYNFVKGLMKINLSRKILVIFDNDTEGNHKYNKCLDLNLPKNIKVVKLPYHNDFENFNTNGTNGLYLMNINNYAVSIECFLNFENIEYKPIVRWTNYIKEMNCYQGALENKEFFLKDFEKNWKDKNYNFDKLEFLINYIYEQCVLMNE